MHFFRRGRHFHYSFSFQGRQFRISGKQFNDGQPVTNIVLAEKIGDYIEVCLIDGKFPETYIENKDRTTLELFRDQYMDWAEKNKISARSDGYLYAQLVRILGSRLIKEISSSDIEKYKLARMGKVSNNTVNHELALLSNIFRIYSLLTGIKIKKPDIVKLKVQEKPIQIIRPETFDRLFAAAPEHIRRFMLLSWYTGCRPSEVLRLQGKHVVDGMFVIERTKTAKTRHIAIHPDLQTIAGSCVGDEYLVSWRGRPLISQVMRKAINRVCRQSGITDKIYPYMFRHTFATGLLPFTDIFTIQNILGHSKIRTTEKYLKFSNARAKDAIGQMATRQKMEMDSGKLAQN